MNFTPAKQSVTPSVHRAICAGDPRRKAYAFGCRARGSRDNNK